MRLEGSTRVRAWPTTLSIALPAASAAAAQPVRIDVTPDGVPADGRRSTWS